MSQHPYVYNPYPGQQSQQPYSYTPTPGQYGHQQESDPASLVGNFATTNRSFDQNASSIPGLGMSASLPVSSYSVGKNDAQWHQGTYRENPSAIHVGGNQRKGSSVVQRQQQPQPQPRKMVPSFPIPLQPTHQDNTLEEGELSESQFEDLYEPRGPGEVLEDRPDPIPADQPGSVGDADGSSIYDTGSTREEVVADSKSASIPAAEEEGYSPGEYYEPESPARERSKSYSPYLSPAEVRRESVTSKSKSNMDKGPDTRLRQQPGGAAPSNGFLLRVQNHDTENFHSRKESAPAPGLPYKSVLEAKKKAQEAILGLWPLKVRFQDYLEEGFDDALVKTLFSELGLDTSPPKVAAPTAQLRTDSHTSAATPSQPSVPATDKPSQTTDNKTMASSQPTKSSTSTAKSDDKSDVNMAEKKAGEERKDKIARMLAEKAQKSTISNSVPAPAASTSVPTVIIPVSKAAPAPVTSESPAPDKAKIKAQNNLKLQQKIEALKKAQEEAKKAEAKKQQTEAGQSAVMVASNTPGKPSTPARPAPSAQQPDQTPSSRTVESVPNPQSSGIPGLFLSSTPQSNSKARNLKRPVASDFDNYAGNGGTLKRSRTQETLIIDVTDDEDDEDVEMDIGSPTSPTEGPLDGIQNNNSVVRQNSLGSFPPLSTSNSWHHKSSPVPSAAQTPAEHGKQLNTLEQQIELAKRKIAEAEAKKAAKKSSGASTPLAQTPATPAALEPAKLPKPAERNQSVDRERRERIASQSLPAIESSLKEKQERLNRLQREAAQLELEVQVGQAEREKLVSELEKLQSGDATEVTVPGEDQQQPADKDLISASQPSEFLPSALAEVKPDLRAAAATCANPIISQSSETHSEAESPDGKSDMVIDSSASCADADVDEHQSDSAGTTSEGAILSRGISDPSDTDQNAPDVNNASAGNNTAIRTNSCLDMTGNQSTNQAATDPDISMQTSDAESDGDAYEPMPAQISSTDKVQVSGDENGEIPDEDPYEPNPAHVPDAVPSVDAAPSTITDRNPAILYKDFVPYESPLRYFRAYRFHPKYLDDIPGGLQSMTYSSRIDISTPVCPKLMDGAKCPDGQNCPFQHFETMELSGTDIITQLGSSDAFTGEQKTRFIEGLKRVLNDLKANKVKDFDQITKAIIKFRTEFLETQEKKLNILPLDGVTT